MALEFNWERLWQKIEALVPVYGENGGNNTEIWLQGGERLVVYLKTKTVLKKLAQVFALDLGELRKKYGRLVGRKNKSPLPLHPSLILVPLKYREPLAKDEGALGYVVKNQLADCRDLTGNKTEISFKDGVSLEFIQSLKSVRLMLAHAEVIEHELINNLEKISGSLDQQAILQIMQAIMTKKFRKSLLEMSENRELVYEKLYKN